MKHQPSSKAPIFPSLSSNSIMHSHSTINSNITGKRSPVSSSSQQERRQHLVDIMSQVLDSFDDILSQEDEQQESDNKIRVE
jgi:hypothetical protein